LVFVLVFLNVLFSLLDLNHVVEYISLAFY